MEESKLETAELPKLTISKQKACYDFVVESLVLEVRSYNSSELLPLMGELLKLSKELN